MNRRLVVLIAIVFLSRLGAPAVEIAVPLTNGPISVDGGRVNLDLTVARTETADRSSALRVIFNPQAGITERVSAAQDLGSELTASQVGDLSSFLVSRPSTLENNLAGLRFLKNEVFDVLRKQSKSPCDFETLCMAIYQDSAQDFVTRDYAIQHLISWCEETTALPVQVRKKIFGFLKEVAQSKNSIGGTALLGVHRLSGQSSATNDAVNDLALDLVRSSGPASLKITAIQVCAERKVTQVVPMLETLVTATNEVALQISAISAMGDLGDQKEASLLRMVERNGNQELTSSIRAALKKIQSKPPRQNEVF